MVRMNRAEWMPTSFCSHIPLGDSDNVCHCDAAKQYRQQVFAQKKLLEYLIADAKPAWLDDFCRIYQDQLESMLTQLDSDNEK